MAVDKDLGELARSYGVATEYNDQVGVRKEVSAESVRAVLSSFGVDASSPKACRQALADLKQKHWESVVPPVLVFRHTSESDPKPWETWVHVTHGASMRMWIELEDGARRFDVVRTQRKAEPEIISGIRVEQQVFRLPQDLPLGWHTLVAETKGVEHSCTLVICPERLFLPGPLNERRGWGVATQLYSLRSKRSWGIGDLGDLKDLASWVGRDLGSDFILVNPLHAAAPTPPMEPSPYLPVTRRFANPLYLRVEEITEFAYLGPAERDHIEKLIVPLRAKDLTPDLLDRDATWDAKLKALAYVNRVPLTPGRQAEFDAYLAAEGEGLFKFALWNALSEEYGSHWDEWPDELQDADSPQVAAEAKRLKERVDFYMWMQWVLDEQMGQAQVSALSAGMDIGVMHDLAVGVHPNGSDTWANGKVMARSVTVGAPPDAYNQKGQDWSQPPLRPDVLAETGYASWREMLRTLLRHSGGLRIDHALGLFRLWWIPEGMGAAGGTFVKYDHHAMVDILVLEAHRTGAVIVGEDLGTVEPWVKEFLAERGILGTTILFFEKERTGERAPRQPEDWRPNAMATVTVHDIPPTLGFLAGDGVKLRHELGLLSTSYEEELAAFQKDIGTWRTMLVAKGLLRENAGEQEFVVALHKALAWSPSKLLCVSLPDMVGDRRTQNQPGTFNEYPNWRIPLCDSDGNPVLLEDLPNVDLVSAIVSAVGGSAGGASRP